MAKVPPVKGTRDFYPEQMAVRNWIFDGWRNVSRRNGFVEYDSPIFEYLQLYTQKSGDEIAGQLFSLTDRGGRELAIRPETTPALARMVNQKINSLPLPIKWFSISRLCRAERPQKGRLREFFQWNIDIIGSDSEYADADCIYTAVDYLRSVGLTPSDIVVKISSRSMLAELLKSQGFAEDQFATVYSLLDKRPKLPEDTFTALAQEQIPDVRLRDKLMQIASIATIDELIAFAPDSVRDSVEPLKRVFTLLENMGVADYCTFDINIVRGLAYYTGIVFEIFDRNAQLRAVGGGGRYDNLLAGMGGQQVAATGFGMGDVVLEILLQEKNIIPPIQIGLDVFVIEAAPNSKTEAKLLQTVNALRSKGFTAVFDYRRIALSKQLKQASTLNARFALIIGDKTLDQDRISLKNMTEGSQKEIPFTDFLTQPERYLS